jgi:hypothetical protein
VSIDKGSGVAAAASSADGFEAQPAPADAATTSAPRRVSEVVIDV